MTLCDRVYTAALGSPKAPHFHAHMIPMYVNADGAFGKPATSWTGTPFDVFLQEKMAADGKEGADVMQCSQVAEAFAAEMARAVGEAPPGKRPKGDEPPKRCAAVLFDLDECAHDTPCSRAIYDSGTRAPNRDQACSSPEERHGQRNLIPPSPLRRSCFRLLTPEALDALRPISDRRASCAQHAGPYDRHRPYRCPIRGNQRRGRGSIIGCNRCHPHAPTALTAVGL